MRLSAASRDALHALAHLAAQPGGRLAIADVIGAACQISGNVVRRMFKPLARAGVVRSVQGRKGGFRLARPASKITLLEVVEAIDGPVRGPAEATGPRNANLDDRVDAVYDEAAARLRRQLGRVRLSELLKRD